ncbi:MAG: hypothetical protein EBU90_30905 [Proteobacteria bacterium]|nr:hypothetical protein [Pseudomonadota bacterium]NBP16900.1 hypothetical protein [bacterium]
MTFKDFFSEKMVIGLIEEITIEDIGKVPAKVDSGNGAYCVIHGDNILITGDNVRFNTVNNKTINKSVLDTININVGAGHVEERPVVEFNIQLGNKTYNNVKFSVGNRSKNEQPVLLGKDFIKDTLDALIDVSNKDLASKNIEVNYK